jgi:putative acyl-CoA dehydrogenase
LSVERIGRSVGAVSSDDSRRATVSGATHEVLNQSVPLEDYDLFAADPLLPAAVEREGGGWGAKEIGALGAIVGSAEYHRWADQANRHEPELVPFDRYGNRIDEVDFHPDYHRLMDVAVTHGIHSLPYERPSGEGARVVRDALLWATSQVEPAHGCPISMTTSVVPALRVDAELAAEWEPAILARDYEPDLGHVRTVKHSALLGMGMTEKQGGSDVRTNTTRAVEHGDGSYRITGHKWFTSAPMCDAFLVLAQAPGGLTCFLLPRILPDGARNALEIQRLKRKLGNRANASAELEFRDAVGHRVGDEGRGVPTIIEMVNGTRLDCIVGATGQMRQAVHQAAWHTAHRAAFGSLLADKPLMRNVLADLELDVEASTLLMTRVSGAFDRAPLDPAEAAFRRIATPVAKYWTTKLCTGVVREAMECLGGNGYVEDFMLARLFRESPLNAIWEGSGNVIALDVLRALTRGSGAGDCFVAELDLARGADRRLDIAIDRCRDALAAMQDPETSARRLVEQMAVTWSASLLVRHGEAAVADAYVASRIVEPHGLLYGTLDARLDIATVAARAQPLGV